MTRTREPASPVRGWPRPRRAYDGDEGRTAGILPEPWIVGYDWSVFDTPSVEMAERDRLCQVCGDPLRAVVVLCRGHRKRTTSGPGCHPRCAALAVRFCPHLLELDAGEIVAPIPIAYRYDGDGLGYDGPLTGWTEEYTVDESAAPLTRAELRELAKTDPLGRGTP